MASASGQLRRAADLLLLFPRPPLSLLPLPHLMLLLLPCSNHHGHHWRRAQAWSSWPRAPWPSPAPIRPDPAAPASPPPPPGLPKPPRALSMPPRPPEDTTSSPWFVHPRARPPP